MKFRNFFEGESKPQKSESEIRAEKAREELDAIEVDADKIIKDFSPEETVELNSRLRKLLNDIPVNERGTELFTLSQEEENLIPDITDEADIVSFIKAQPPRAIEFMVCMVVDWIKEFEIGEKFLAYDKEHWKQVFDETVNGGVTPFGDERSLMKDLYLKQGIDLENPTEGDVNAFFQSRGRYSAGSIGTEIGRKRRKEFSDLSPLNRETTSILLSRLLIKQSHITGKQEAQFYKDDEKIARLIDIKEKLEA